MFLTYINRVTNVTVNSWKNNLYHPRRCLNVTRQNKNSKEKQETSEEFETIRKPNPPNPYKPMLEENKEESLIHPLEFLDMSNYVDKSARHPKYMPEILRKLRGSQHFNSSGPVGFKKMFSDIRRRLVFKDQSYKPDRVTILGPDLSAAHFFMCRGGGIKFVGENKFLRCKKNRSNEVIPNYKDETYKVEAIDASNMNLIYESLKNLSDLKYLKWISFKNVQNFDNWYLDHLSLVAPNIEYLDISFCKKLDYNALTCLYRFNKLQCFNVEGINDTENLFKLSCLTIESENPNLTVIGIALKKKPKSVFN